MIALLLVVTSQVSPPNQAEAQGPGFMDFNFVFDWSELDFSWLEDFTFEPVPVPIFDKVSVRKECPIIGQTTGPDGGTRPGGDRKYCETATINMCNYKNIENGAPFKVYADSANKQGTPSDWVIQNGWLDVELSFTKGTAGTRTVTPGGRKRNVMNVIYDGNCGVKVTSQYQGDSSNYKRAYATLSSFGFVRGPAGPQSEVTVTAVPDKIKLGGTLTNNLTLITWSAPTSEVCVSEDFDTGGATSGSKLVPVSSTKDIRIICSNTAADTVVEDQTEVNLAGPRIGLTGLEGTSTGGGYDIKGGTFDLTGLTNVQVTAPAQYCKPGVCEGVNRVSRDSITNRWEDGCGVIWNDPTCGYVAPAPAPAPAPETVIDPVFDWGFFNFSDMFFLFKPTPTYAQATEAHGYRPGGDRKYVESPKVNICNIKPDLQNGDSFFIYGDSALNGTRSSWSDSNYYMDIKFEFTKGAGGVREYVKGGDKRNHFKAYYDGNCMTYFSSQYQGESSNYKDAYATYSKVGFNRTVEGDIDPATAKTGQVTVTVENVTELAPTVAIAADPTTIVSGQSTTISWESENATTCSGTNFNTAGALDGSVVVPITMPAGGTQLFSVMCSGPAGNTSQSVNVNVTQAPLTAVVADLRATRASITYGDNTRLEWSSQNATTCVGTGFDTEGLTAGSKTVVPSETTTYRVTCSAGANSAVDDATVTVADLPEPPIFSDCVFNGSIITHGSSVTAWEALSVPNGQTCSSETRTCNNEVLSGGFQFGSCTVGDPDDPTDPPVPPVPPGDCLFNGNLVTSGSSVTAYQAPSVDYDTGSCSTQERICTDGNLSGSYVFNSCVVDGPIPTDFLCSKDNNTWLPCTGVFTLSTRKTPMYVKADNDVENWYQCGDTTKTRATFTGLNDQPRSAKATFNYIVPVTAANQVQDMSFCLNAVNTPDIQKTFKIKLLDFGFNET